MSELQLAQTLHGYDGGHRLLAASARLAADELALLDRLSDLSGYLPSGASFQAYHTGFRCGRWYAFACTWPDPHAPRSGSVLTHTLLAPLEAAVGLPDLWALAYLHKRADRGERQRFQHTITYTPVPDAPPPLPPDHRAAAALWFGQVQRPVLWVQEQPPGEVVQQIWQWLWPEERRKLSFCTFAVQSRSIDGQPFSFLGLPPEATGGFYNLARSTSWFVDGRAQSPGVQAQESQPWLESVVQDPATISKCLGRCREAGLPLPSASGFSKAWRYWDLEEGSRQRLAAARARADLLHHLWPSLSGTHPQWQQVALQLLEHQPQASLEPRPLWELIDLFRRSEVQTLLRGGGQGSERLQDGLQGELQRRLQAVPGPARAALPELMDVFETETGLSVVVRAVVGQLRQGPVDVELGRIVLGVLLQRPLHMPGLLKAVVGAVDGADRSLVVLATLKHSPQETYDRTLDRLVESAVALQDAGLVLVLLDKAGLPHQGIDEAARLLLTLPGRPLHKLAGLTTHLAPLLRLEWSLDVIKPELSEVAGELGAIALGELGWSIDQTAGACENRGGGGAVFARRAATEPASTLRTVLRAHPDLCLKLIHHAIGGNGRGGRSFDLALDDCPQHLVLQSSLADFLGRSSNAQATRLARHLGPVLVRGIATGVLDAEAGASWLRIESIQRAIAQSSRWRLWEKMPRGLAPVEALPRLVSAVVSAGENCGEDESPWYLDLLNAALLRVDAPHLLTSTDELLSLLGSLQHREARLSLQAEVLGAARRALPPDGYRLVAAAFPPVYAALSHGEEALLRDASWWSELWWDRAKRWRHWLIDTWARQKWPVELLAELLLTDENLKRKGLRRADRVWSRRFAESVSNAIETIENSDPH